MTIHRGRRLIRTTRAIHDITSDDRPYNVTTVNTIVTYLCCYLLVQRNIELGTYADSGTIKTLTIKVEEFCEKHRKNQ